MKLNRDAHSHETVAFPFVLCGAVAVSRKATVYMIGCIDQIAALAENQQLDFLPE